MRVCKHCGREYAGWRCACRRKGKRGGRSRSAVSVGCGTRSWSLANARARMLGGFGGQAEVWPGVEGVDGPAVAPQYAVCGRCKAVIEVPEGVAPTQARCPACWERVGASRSDNEGQATL